MAPCVLFCSCLVFFCFALLCLLFFFYTCIMELLHLNRRFPVLCPSTVQLYIVERHAVWFLHSLAQVLTGSRSAWHYDLGDSTRVAARGGTGDSVLLRSGVKELRVSDGFRATTGTSTSSSPPRCSPRRRSCRTSRSRRWWPSARGCGTRHRSSSGRRRVASRRIMSGVRVRRQCGSAEGGGEGR